MRKNQVRVIKGINNGLTEQIKTEAHLPKNESDIRFKLGNVVKNWISERRENSRIEKLFSESNILAWKISASKLAEGTKQAR